MKRFGFILILFVFGCNSSKKLSNTPTTKDFVINGKIFTSVYQQQAAEYGALCLQAYNIAKWQVDNFIHKEKPPAIITDIDETLLDNSAYEVHQTLAGKDFELPSWYEWTSKSQADTNPGSLSFFQYASSRGIQIFYITNREERERTGTLINLQKFHFPDANNDHLIVRQSTSSKEARRQLISGKFDVVLYLGDNLSDFSSLFDSKSVEERRMNTDKMSQQFGNRFIILPNTVYGDWESSMYKYNYKLSANQIDSIIRSILKRY